MKTRMHEALLEYADVITSRGHEAGEALIIQYEEQFKDFRRWANAIGIMLRAEEILNEIDRYPT